MSPIAFPTPRAAAILASTVLKAALLLLLLVPARAGDPAARALIGRVLPGRAEAFRLERIPADHGRDVFEVEAGAGAVVLRGNGTLSLAAAFNWYLRRVAHVDCGWLAEGPAQAPDPLPAPPARVRRVCAAPERFFLNPCTFGYTLPWWRRDRWERLLDWMAMNGINRPLLNGGQESVWARVWASFGLPPEEVAAMLPGPAHLPWHRMGNLDAWAGPPPQDFLEAQERLQKDILARARELGMRPVLPAFAGHVPEGLRRLRPGARITPIKPGWGGMDPQWSTWFLSPADPLFQEVARRFLAEQARTYGSDHLYAADPFNEMPPPSWEPAYLARVAAAIYEGMRQADPEAVWYQMAWTFRWFKQWDPARVAALTGAVPKGRLAYLEYAGEQVEMYGPTGGFAGAPFLWCYLGNFGGTTNLVAPLGLLAERGRRALARPACLGLGATPEGLTPNQVAYDLLFDLAWEPGLDLGAWVRDHARRRAGGPDPAVERAWATLLDQVLREDDREVWVRGCRLQTIPGGPAPAPPPWDRAALVKALREMLAARPESLARDGVRCDLVRLLQQALGDLSNSLGARMERARLAGDRAAFRAAADRFLDLGRDMDLLAGCRPETLLGRWLDDAASWGCTEPERIRLRQEARQLLTTWHRPGRLLEDYAACLWQGLIGTYDLPRWQGYIAQVDAALAEGRSFDPGAYTSWRIPFEQAWVDTDRDLPVRPSGDAVALVRRLYRTWAQALAEPREDGAGAPAAGPFRPACLTGPNQAGWSCSPP